MGAFAMTGLLAQLLIVVVCFSQSAISKSKHDCIGDFPSDNKYLYRHGHKCYYFYFKEKADFSVAEKRCSKTRGRLAMVKSKDVNQFLHTTLEYTLSDDLPHKDKYFWIGLSDDETEGEYTWSDGSPLDDKYKNFARFKGPHNPFSIVQDCVAISVENGKWYDFKCSTLFLINEHRPYICEYNVSKHNSTTTRGPV